MNKSKIIYLSISFCILLILSIMIYIVSDCNLAISIMYFITFNILGFVLICNM